MATVIDPAFVVGGLGEHVVQNAALVGRDGYPPALAGLGIVDESDAWLTGRVAGLPGTTVLQVVRQPDGSCAATQLGAAAIEPGYRVPSGYNPNGLGLISNEIQRSIGYGDALAPAVTATVHRGWLVGAVATVVAVGIIGCIAARER